MLLMVVVLVLLLLGYVDDDHIRHNEHFTRRRITWPIMCAKRPVGKNLKLPSQRRVLPTVLRLIRFESIENKK
jgi:hypothetical protein